MSQTGSHQSQHPKVCLLKRQGPYRQSKTTDTALDLVQLIPSASSSEPTSPRAAFGASTSSRTEISSSFKPDRMRASTSLNRNTKKSHEHHCCLYPRVHLTSPRRERLKSLLVGVTQLVPSVVPHANSYQINGNFCEDM